MYNTATSEGKLVDLARISLAEFRENIRRCPAVTFAIGSVEWHGAHLPLGFDTLKADALCRRIADEVGCFVAPPLYYGYAYHFYQSGLMPAMFSDIDAFGEYLKSVFFSFSEIGFKVIYAMTGHYENLQVLTIRTAAQLVMDEVQDLSIICCRECDLTDETGYHGDHAGMYETSLGLALFPELIHLDAKGTAADLNLGYKPQGDREPANFGSWEAYFEDGKSKASQEIGQELVEVIVRKAAEKIRDALENPSRHRNA